MIRAIPQTDGGEGVALSVPWLLLHCLGFGCCWGWVHVGFFSAVLLGASEDAGTLSWLVNLVANGVTMVAAGAASRSGGWLARRGAAWSIALVAGGTLVTALLFGGLPLAVWLALGPAATGVGTAMLLLMWSQAYAEIDLGLARRYTLPGSMMAGVVVYLLVTALSEGAAVTACACLPAVSVVCLKSTFQVGRPEPGASPAMGEGSFRRVLLRFVAVVAVYCLPSGFMSGSSSWYDESGPGSTGTLTFAGIAVLLVAVAVLSALPSSSPDGDFSYRFIVPLMAAGLLLTPFVTGAAGAAANVAIMGGYIILEMYAWSSLLEIARASGRPCAYVFGLGKSGMNLGLLAGCMLRMFASSRPTMIGLAISVTLVYAFILMGAVAPAGRKRMALVDSSVEGGCPGGAGGLAATAPAEGLGASEQPLAPSIEELRAAQCRSLAREFGLSAREEDVLRMLLAGRSIEAAAEALGIAPSTVRSHRDHLYRKLGVHTRQELLDLVERAG